MNPLFARELRARWRDRRAWWLILALTGALAFLAYSMFLNGVSRGPESVRVLLPNGNYTFREVQMTPSARAARSGRELFMALALGNVAAWLLVAPILTATPIARERERGLLESLQLSHLTPRSQIAARVGAALIFLLLLQLAVAPIYAIIFWLGGVSPGEFALAGAIISLTALGGIGAGTFISARSHRPSNALFAALGFVVLWTLALYPAGYGAFAPTAGKWVYPASVLLWSHPLPLALVVTDASGQNLNMVPLPLGWELGHFVAALCALWGIISLILLVLATRAVRKPLPPAAWGGRASAPVESWRRSIAQRESVAPKKRRIENTMVADVPIDKIFRSANPLLEREVRSRFRLRRGGLALMLGRFALFAAGVWTWGYAIYSLSDGLMRKDVSSALLYTLWILGALTIGALSSSGFARERESGTWEALKLSLLRPLEIVRAKWLSPLWAFAIYSLPLWLLVPFGIAYADKSGMDAGAMALSIGIVVLSLGTISMVGLLVSWRARHPNTALGWVLGLGLFLFVAVPILREATDVDRKITRWLYGVDVRATPYFHATAGAQYRAVDFQYLTSFWHPITALTYVQDEGNRGASELEPLAALQVQLAVFVLIAGGGAWTLRREIARDREQNAGG